MLFQKKKKKAKQKKQPKPTNQVYVEVVAAELRRSLKSPKCRFITAACYGV